MAEALRPDLRLLSFPTLDSTNEEARRRAQAGAPEGTAIVAETQTAGRGRMGRTWDSPPGNLHCSLLLRPGCWPEAAANLSFAAALAVRDAVAGMLSPANELRFKWPNDVLLDGRKLAGILLESEISGGALQWLVVGVGVNVARHPAEAMYPATSLAAAGCAASLEAVRDAYFDCFRLWYGRWRAEGFAPLRAAWLAGAAALGREIEVRAGAETLRGVFSDLDSEGALMLETPAGRRKVTAGDVFLAASGRAGA